MKRCPTSLIIRQEQIKTTMSITSHCQNGHLQKKNLQTTNAGEGMEKSAPSTLGGMGAVIAAVENGMEAPSKTKLRATI